MARLYSNENIAQPVVVELRRLRHDVLTSLEAGKANAAVPDSEVLEFASVEKRILLSHNRLHFLRLHRNRSAPHSGMILCTFDPDFRALANRIHEVLVDHPEMADRLIRVNRAG